MGGPRGLPGASSLAAFVLGAVVLVCALHASCGSGPFDWMQRDMFDDVNDMMDRVNPENCRSKPKSELYLPPGSVTQLPRANKLLSTIIYPNRTSLLHLHNMALNRAFFWSYIHQQLNRTWMFNSQPGLMYYYFSCAADVSANEYFINGSAIIYDNNSSYPNWYRDVPFNQTLNLFGPRAFRFDDYNDPTNWLREPTNTTIDITDYGAGPQNNYTIEAYKINQWYQKWLPDNDPAQDFKKHSYDVGIKYSNETGKFTDNEFQAKAIFGPPSPGQNDDENLPVTFTQPYYDCGRSNKWIISAVAPVVDQLPRYLEWNHLRRFVFTSVSVMDLDFLSVDINPCPKGEGNNEPNIFAGTARCKATTICEPLHGWGYKRGGYHCMCKPGYRLPPWQNGPFQGGDIDSATKEEYDNGFDCIPVELRQVLPIIRGNQTSQRIQDSVQRIIKKRAVKKPIDYRQDHIAEVHTSRLKRSERNCKKMNDRRRLLRSVGLKPLAEEEVAEKKKISLVTNHPQVHKRAAESRPKLHLVPRIDKKQIHSRKKRQAFDNENFQRTELIRMKKERVNAANCRTFKPEDLELPGDVSFAVEKQFAPEAQTALRLAHFLSNFMQNIDFYEEYGNLRGDRLLNIEQLFGEVVSNVMANHKIKASGIFYDIDKFKEPTGKIRQFFGPYAYKFQATHYRAIDFAGYPEHYLDEPWFRNVKERWQSNTFGLTKFTEKPMIRSDKVGGSLKRFELYPLYYKAPKVEDGWWSAPYFDCDGHVNDWIITYSVPFFGLNSIGTDIEFKGVVIVDVPLDELDIEQCPAPFHVPNAFKNTARCHFESTYCVPLPGQKWTKGGYKCECRQGYEYHFKDRAWYFDGQTMEKEYEKKVLGQTNRFDTLRCRISGAGKVSWNLTLAFILAVITTVLH